MIFQVLLTFEMVGIFLFCKEYDSPHFLFCKSKITGQNHKLPPAIMIIRYSKILLFGRSTEYLQVNIDNFKIIITGYQCCSGSFMRGIYFVNSSLVSFFVCSSVHLQIDAFLSSTTVNENHLLKFKIKTN